MSGDCYYINDLPECSGLDDDLHGARESAVLRERLIEINGQVVRIDAQVGDDIVGLAFL